MALDDSWELNESGQVVFAAFAGYSMATVPHGALVRLEFAKTAEDIEKRRSSGLQLHMSAPQARELAEALRRLADEMDRQERQGQS